MTQRQSNYQWSGGIVAYPATKYSKCNNPLELLISAGANEVHFEGKTPHEGHQEGLVLA